MNSNNQNVKFKKYDLLIPVSENEIIDYLDTQENISDYPIDLMRDDVTDFAIIKRIEKPKNNK